MITPVVHTSWTPDNALQRGKQYCVPKVRWRCYAGGENVTSIFELETDDRFKSIRSFLPKCSGHLLSSKLTRAAHKLLSGSQQANTTKSPTPSTQERSGCRRSSALCQLLLRFDRPSHQTHIRHHTTRHSHRVSLAGQRLNNRTAPGTRSSPGNLARSPLNGAVSGLTTAELPLMDHTHPFSDLCVQPELAQD